jgi:hypothetical protein
MPQNDERDLRESCVKVVIPIERPPFYARMAALPARACQAGGQVAGQVESCRPRGRQLFIPKPFAAIGFAAEKTS